MIHKRPLYLRLIKATLPAHQPSGQQWWGRYQASGSWPCRWARGSRSQRPCRQRQRPLRTSTHSQGTRQGRDPWWQPGQGTKQSDGNHDRRPTSKPSPAKQVSVSLSLKMSLSWPLFLYFWLIYLNVQLVDILLPMCGIRTEDFWCRKWPLYHLSQNHFLLSLSLYNYCNSWERFLIWGYIF